jgi:hypothetical protein
MHVFSTSKSEVIVSLFSSWVNKALIVRWEYELLGSFNSWMALLLNARVIDIDVLYLIQKTLGLSQYSSVNHGFILKVILLIILLL